MRGVDSATIAAVDADVTKPIFLVVLGFDIPVAYSSGESIDVGFFTCVSASMRISGTPPKISIFNDALGLGAAILSQNTTARGVSIWETYATTTVTAGAPLGYTPLLQTFSGEMSGATVGETIEIQCKAVAPLRCPRKIIAPPACNHLPAAGTRIEMPAEVYILK